MSIVKWSIMVIVAVSSITQCSAQELQRGESIVDFLRERNVPSSFEYRRTLWNEVFKNESRYVGSAAQNIRLHSLFRFGEVSGDEMIVDMLSRDSSRFNHRSGPADSGIGDFSELDNQRLRGLRFGPNSAGTRHRRRVFPSVPRARTSRSRHESRPFDTTGPGIPGITRSLSLSPRGAKRLGFSAAIQLGLEELQELGLRHNVQREVERLRPDVSRMSRENGPFVAATARIATEKHVGTGMSRQRFVDSVTLNAAGASPEEALRKARELTSHPQFQPADSYMPRSSPQWLSRQRWYRIERVPFVIDGSE